MDDMRAVLDAASVDARPARRRRGRRTARVPVRGHVPRADARARADEHRAAHRVGAGLPLGFRDTTSSSDARGDRAGWGTRALAEQDAPWPMEGMTRRGGRRLVARMDAPLGRRPATPSRSGGCSTTRTYAMCSARSASRRWCSAGAARWRQKARLRRASSRRGAARVDARLGAGRDAGAHRRLHGRPHRVRAGAADEEAELESVLATVLFTDIVDSTARQAELGDRRWPPRPGPPRRRPRLPGAISGP